MSAYVSINWINVECERGREGETEGGYTGGDASSFP